MAIVMTCFSLKVMVEEDPTSPLPTLTYLIWLFFFLLLSFLQLPPHFNSTLVLVNCALSLRNVSSPTLGFYCD